MPPRAYAVKTETSLAVSHDIARGVRCGVASAATAGQRVENRNLRSVARHACVHSRIRSRLGCGRGLKLLKPRFRASLLCASRGEAASAAAAPRGENRNLVCQQPLRFGAVRETESA